MTDIPASPCRPSGLDILRAELPDLAFDLERQGRLDAADVVMMLHARVRELAAAQRDSSSWKTPRAETVSIHPS